MPPESSAPLSNPKNESLLQAFKRYFLAAVPDEYAPMAELFDHPEDVMTLRDRLKRSYDQEKAAERAEGRKIGREEGRIEGLKEGRVEGQRALLQKLLEKKFGPLDEVSTARLAKATPAKLGKWALRVLTAKSLEEIWA